MVEQDVIYEEIRARRKHCHTDVDSSNPSNVAGYESPTTDENETHFSRNSIYEDMNGLGEELAETYNIENVHYRQSSDSLLILQKKPTLYAHVNCHSRNSSSSSSTEDETKNRRYQRLASRSAQQLGQLYPLENYEKETIYSEIVTNSSLTEITTGRITRESQNPILQQNKFSVPFNPVQKSNNSPNHEITVNGMYGYIESKKQNKTNSLGLNAKIPVEIYENSTLFLSRSTSTNENDGDIYENSRPPMKTDRPLSQTTDNEEELYENSRPPMKLERFVSQTTDNGVELYENSRPPTKQEEQRFDKNHSTSLTQHDTCNQTPPFYQTHEQHDLSAQTFLNTDLARSTESVTSLYENVAEQEDIYENLSDNDWGTGEFTRDRSSSKPINITPNTSFENSNEFHRQHRGKKQIAPFSISSMSSSVTSSPRGSICSSISSEQTPSLSPPPVFPLCKRKQTSTSSWSDLSAFRGLNYFPANYLGKHNVSRLTRDCIDEAISYVAQRTNLLEMKPVVAEVNHDLIRIGSNSSPWELYESFLVEEVVNIEVVVKNVPFIGIIAGNPGEEATCYVLQSEKATEISEAIREVFQTDSKKKLSKSRSSHEVSIQHDFHRFHFLVKVGSTKVHRSFRCVNEYIKLVLEKVNPKDFRTINLEVLGSNVVITDPRYEEEHSHSTPSILSLGVYSGDKRYFGYIITETSSGKKQPVHCHVYRAARNSTSANIIDAISTSYQSAYSPRSSDNCDMNPIYAPTYSTNKYSSNKNSPVTPTTNPIYSKLPVNAVHSHHSSITEETNYGRNSITSLSSNGTSIGSLNYTVNSSPDVSPSSTLPKRHRPSQGNSSIIEKLNILRTSTFSHRLSLNIECLSEEQKGLIMNSQKTKAEETDSVLIDLGSTDTLLTLTPNSPCSPGSLPRSSPVTRNNSAKKERPKSLPLLDLDDYRSIEDNDQRTDERNDLERDADQRKSKSKKLFNKFCGSIRGKLTPVNAQTPLQTPTLNGSADRLNGSADSFHFVEKPIPLEDEISSTTHIFKIIYICSTLVKPPLRPKHVRECYKQFAKEMHKAEKVSNNNGLRTVGSPVELVIVTDTEIVMLDPKDPNTIIRQCSIDLYEKFVLHPDDNMGCFAFSTTVPGNQHKHKIHLFTIQKHLKSNIVQAFAQFEENKFKIFQKRMNENFDSNLI